MHCEELKRWYCTHQKAIFEDFFTFLRFKSISTDLSYDRDTKQCADWLVSYLKVIGLDVFRWETSGQPVVFAQHYVGPDRPTLLIYHHYDVQPVDPLDLWHSDPFEPVLRDGNIFARGAQDNKGQCFYTLTALKAVANKLKCNLKLFIEGEEESGSKGTLEILEEKKEELCSDYLLIVDSHIPAPNVPGITLGTRGILSMEAEIRVADIDMHSGGMGGVACNPIRAFCGAFSLCFDEKGRIAIPHFYDDVEDLSSEEKKLFDLELDKESLLKEFGLRKFCPEPGYTIGESASIRPTLEINGINGGYTGEGFKTVLPAAVFAKISCRLVPHQDPEKIFQQIEKHLQKNLPQGVECRLIKESHFAAFRSNPHSQIAKLVRKAYEEVMGKPCKAILSGGSIPIAPLLAQASGAEAVMMGFGLESDFIHAPNEHFGIDRFEQGFLTIGRILEQLNAEKKEI